MNILSFQIKSVFSILIAVVMSFSVQGQTKTAAKPTTPASKTTSAAPTTKPPVAAKAAPTTKPPVANTAFVLKNAIDSMSYAIGMLDANFFKTQGITSINSAALARGFADAMKGTTMCSTDQADQIVRFQMQRMSRQKIQPNIDEGLKFLAENAKKPGVKQTASGLQYEVITEGTGEKPVETSTVKVHYEGFLLNGRIFDSSRNRGEPTQFGLNQVIRGWTEGVQLMSVGSKYKFYIPYQLAYGEQGAGADIPGGSTLIFEVELIEIVKAN